MGHQPEPALDLALAHPPPWGVRSPHIAAMVLAMLCSASAAEAADYARQVSACWFIRMPASERPVCCDFSAKDRFTEPGGDCCKMFVWDSSEPAADAGANHSVALSLLAVNRATPAVAPRFAGRTAPNPFARGPPALPLVTDTVVLRI